MDLQQLIADRIATGLRRKSITEPSKWAEYYREMPEGRWSFRRYPWLREMHNCRTDYCVGQKAAQMGFTETLLNLTFFCIDVLGKNVLYVLPNKNPDAGDFSTGRFDPALELSPHLRRIFSNVDNIGHKRAGAASLYIRGSQSRSGLKSIPVSRLFLDEVAEFVEANIPLAFERVSGQLDKQVWLVSTPTLPGFGISKYYDQSDKKIFTFSCPSCSKHIGLHFPDSMINLDDPDNAQLICTECKNILPHQDKPKFLGTGSWEPQFDNKEWAGFGVSQLYSTTVTPKKLALSYQESLTNAADEMEFYNSKLGTTHETEGARVKDSEINDAIVDGPKHYRRREINNDHFYVLGIDVGKFLHYEVDRVLINKGITNFLDINSHTKVIVEDFGKYTNINDIDALFDQYNIVSCVIDANPERRMALEFARRHYGKVQLCFFSRGVAGRTISYTHAESDDEPYINVDRSSWLDLALGRFKNKSIYLPVDTNIEYKQQIKEPVKTYKKDDKGNVTSVYLTKDNTDDHYAFSRCYAEIAQAFLSRYYSVNEDIEVEV